MTCGPTFQCFNLAVDRLGKLLLYLYLKVIKLGYAPLTLMLHGGGKKNSRKCNLYGTALMYCYKSVV